VLVQELSFSASSISAIYAVNKKKWNGIECRQLTAASQGGPIQRGEKERERESKKKSTVSE
jgi:hypothetical protein